MRPEVPAAQSPSDQIWVRGRLRSWSSAPNVAVMLQATFSRAKVAPARCKRSTTAAGAHKNCANDRRQMKNFGVLSRFSSIWLIALILAIGIFLRVWPSTSFRLSGEGKSDHPAQADEEQKKGVWVGRDERAYCAYVALARKDGILNFGDVVRAYLQSQANRPDRSEERR